MTAPTAFLFFDGHCAEAMRHYERVLGGKLEQLVSESEAPGAAQGGKRIMFASLLVNGGVLTGSDWMADRPYEKKQGFYVSLVYDSAAEVRRVYEALAEGGRINLPLQKTFFTEAFGMLVDRYGTPWMIRTAPASG
ncbi:MAG: VOC family protein [Bacillota bacterium]